jgi:hypothetical protein
MHVVVRHYTDPATSPPVDKFSGKQLSKSSSLKKTISYSEKYRLYKEMRSQTRLYTVLIIFASTQ